MVFLSLCLGAVLVEYVASQANDMIEMFIPRLASASAMSIQLALLLAPAVVTAIVTVFGIHGRAKVTLNALPAMATSALALLLTVPLFTPGLRFALESQPTWRILSNADALIIGAGALVSLFFLWSQRGSFRRHDKRR